YRVGLLAAITRPSAEMSRTRSPRVTAATRTRAASTDWLPALQADTSQPASTSTPTAMEPPSSHCRRFFAGPDELATGWSWPEVSRMLIAAALMRVGDLSGSEQVPCQSPCV